MPLDLDQFPRDEIAAFCRRNHISRLAVFGSALREDFTAESDIDVLVEFEPGETPGFRFFRLQYELGALLGRPVDLNTPQCLSSYFRDEVLAEARNIYVAA
jgi:hypothetical protein